MEIRNLGDKYYARLDKSDSHGRSIINWINVLVKVRHVHMVKRSGTQRNEEISHDLERPPEVPKVGDMFHSTPASEDLCQRDLPKTQEWCQLMLQQSQENHGSSGKSAHDNLDIDTHYNVIKDVYVPEELKRPHTDVNTVSVEQQRNDHIRPNADLETRPQIRSKEELKCMYPECFDGIGEFKIKFWIPYWTRSQV